MSGMPAVPLLTALVGWTVRASFVLLLALGTAALFRRNATWRHLVWLTGLSVLLLIPFVPLPAAARLVIPATVPPPFRQIMSEVEPGNSPPVELPAVDPTVPPGAAAIVAGMLILWLAGVILVVTQGLCGWYGVQRLSARSRRHVLPIPELRELAARAGVNAPWELRIAGKDAPPVPPMTWGVLRPVILLPADSLAWPYERMRAVLLHELAHARRADCWSQTLAHLACAFYWFHPAVWLAARALREAAEAAADAAVLNAGVRRCDYADALLHCAAAVAKRRAAFAGLEISPRRRSALEYRLATILAPPASSREMSTVADWLIGVVGLAAVLLCASLRLEFTVTRQPEITPLPSAPALLRKGVRPFVPAPPSDTWEVERAGEQVRRDGERIAWEADRIRRDTERIGRESERIQREAEQIRRTAPTAPDEPPAPPRP